jgi:TolB-like protein/DNA-binding SARP family transcriptional activator
MALRGVAMETASAFGNGTKRPSRWSLRLFGGFELVALPGSEKVALPGKRERVLLAYLALSPNGREKRRKLAALLWGDATDETLLDNLRASIWKLRKVLGDTEHRIVASEGEDIVLDASAFEVDALTFVRLAAQSGRLELEAAAKMYSGELLAGLGIDSEEFESWRRATATRYRDQAVEVLDRLMTQLSGGGEAERAIETGVRILQLEPLHEPAVRRLMRLYCESGRRGPAIQLYRTLADALKSELDAQPEAETRVIFAELARGGEERSGAPMAPTPPATPDAQPPPLSPAAARPNQSTAESSYATASIAELPSRAANVAQQSDSSSKPLRPPFRLRAPLAILAGVLLVAIAFISYREFAPLGTHQAVVGERGASTSESSAVSIAVLPFVNLSGDAGQDFFSDGMTEEITSALAKVPDLRVVGRTSAFQFKGQNHDLRAIGQSLAVTHLIEGSVRKAGDRVRITVQLIKADDGTHLWSEDYDRELTDIFAVQEDIARAITASLRMPLGLKPGENLVNNRSIDPESYQQFLRARALIGRTQSRPTEAIQLLEHVLARNPDYAPAWERLAYAYVLMPTFGPAIASVDEARRVIDGYISKVEAAAKRAIELDPNLAAGYSSLGFAMLQRGDILMASDLEAKAFALDPNDPSSLHSHSIILAILGQVKQANAMRQQLRALDPFVPLYNRWSALYLWVDGQNDAAISILNDIPSNPPGPLAMIYAWMARYAEAADLLENAPAPFAKDAARVLRTAPAKAAEPQSLPQLGGVNGLNWVYLYVGAPERALEPLASNISITRASPAAIPFMWHASWAPVRKTERFKAYVRSLGLVDYWHAKGWPEFCHPTSRDDFACD